MAVKRDASRQVLPSLRLTAVVLAGGAGRRFGGAKLTAPRRDGVLLDGALQTAFAAPVEEVIVVEGADPAVGPAAERQAAHLGQAERLRRVRAHDWSDGLAASLRAGLGAVPSGRDGAFVFLGDMPAIPPNLAAMLCEHLGEGVLAAVPEFRGQAGHPVLIRAELFPALMGLQGDRGARAVLEALGPALARAPVETPGVLFDVDTREALAG